MVNEEKSLSAPAWGKSVKGPAADSGVQQLKWPSTGSLSWAATNETSCAVNLTGFLLDCCYAL